jgi:hypothetical protein
VIASELPVAVTEGAHWRVNFRPASYDAQRLGSLSECLDLIEKHRVLLRGWDFPHLPSRRDKQVIFGSRWVAAWSDYQRHLEYWRMYQSTQFLYLGSVREVTDPDWSAKLKATLSWQLADPVDIQQVPGLVSITNLIFNVTEFFEFAARLAQASLYVEPVTISVQLNRARGFLLTAEDNRMFMRAFAAGDNHLAYETTLTPTELVAAASDQSATCAMWFLERFGMLKPNLDVIRRDQQQLLTRRF